MITLTVEPRDIKIKPETLREAGIMPAVFYGPKQQSTSVTVSTVEFIKAYKKAGESSVIILKEGGTEHEALIHEIDVHPVTGAPRHADFYIIEKGKKVKVNVPLVFSGISPAVKDKAAILVKVARELEIEAAPRELPHELIVDISSLIEFSSIITAKDIKLPVGVILVSGPDEIIASVSEAKEEIEEVKPIDMSAIEVTKKGKEAKEGEEGSETPVAEAKKEEKK
ncbi:MAG: 50S ribosomal protein L25 [Candidatus Taylorbacteria bacterium]|nr:50S ribosomal protein L25 [Candidatus Taylorbacteria bacterium]